MKDKEFCHDQSMTSLNGYASPEHSSGPSMIPAINRINHTAGTANGGTFSNSTMNSSNLYLTPRSLRTRNYTFQSLPIVHTPTPPSRLQKITNPFEAGLAERLHLPFIGSPSLFHRAETPKHCSTPTHQQFEWTIDDVSSLNPANVEAYDTQFISQTDPDVEAKAQAAISSFFKEQIIVPSPSINGLGGQKPLFKIATAAAVAAVAISTTCTDTPSSSQTKKRRRDNSAQTELTLPPTLPADLEAALKPYFTYTQSQQNCVDDVGDVSMNSVFSAGDTTVDYDARDASLRRKLFHNSPSSSDVSDTEYQREVLELDSPAPQTPELMEHYGCISNGDIRRDAFSDFDDIFCDNYDNNLELDEISSIEGASDQDADGDAAEESDPAGYNANDTADDIDDDTEEL